MFKEEKNASAQPAGCKFLAPTATRDFEGRARAGSKPEQTNL